MPIVQVTSQKEDLNFPCEKFPNKGMSKWWGHGWKGRLCAQCRGIPSRGKVGGSANGL